MEVCILGAHNIESRETRLTSLLVDGVLAIDAGGLTSVLSLAEQKKIETVLLTHHHFDHSRDLVTLGFNAALWQGHIEVYALRQTLDVLTTCLLDGKMYANLLQYPSKERPSLLLKTIESNRGEVIRGYGVLALPAEHNMPAVGYQVTSRDGKSFFYTGDTGPGLSHCWQYVSPQVLITEACGPNEFAADLAKAGHLCPRLLGEELREFRNLKGYLPQVIVIHVPPPYEQKIREEIGQVAGELRADISLGYEGMKFTL